MTVTNDQAGQAPLAGLLVVDLSTTLPGAPPDAREGPVRGGPDRRRRRLREIDYDDERIAGLRKRDVVR